MGFAKQRNFAGSAYPDGTSSFTLPDAQPADSFALGGEWSVSSQFATPSADGARVRLRFHATTVRMVLAGTGTVRVRQGDGAWRDIDVSGVPRSYPAVTGSDGADAVLDLQVATGVEVYSFTFG
ncbi:hypothetical protein [Microbacterium elymi]|uniref:DipZ thioredoxin-like C-terminal domain-containing protein n=1 Tax=Microbacterium elymi TaxID=2909587 RepID=A0ABY5NNM3_9MICO|nr:hypothetical protein [Microbacterium elymi]UUT36719.1 hypothetical protein L2X98_34675 [Microbacterium elymi]